MATGYGVDTWCTDHLRTGRFARGKLALGQALFRRLITPNGSLPALSDSDPETDYGEDLGALVGATLTDAELAVWPAKISSELEKDDRVLGVDVSMATQRTPDGTTVNFSIVVTPRDEGGDFTLTMSVSEAGVRLVGINV